MTRPNLPRRPKRNPRAAAGRAVDRAGSLDPLSSPAYKRAMPHVSGDLNALVEKVLEGGAEKYHKKNAEEGKLFVRERLKLLFDDLGDFVEDGLLANNGNPDLPADGVV